MYFYAHNILWTRHKLSVQVFVGLHNKKYINLLGLNKTEKIFANSLEKFPKMYYSIYPQEKNWADQKVC